ncbi:histidine phosphatase family protein [Melissococcus plutonius]|uniref:Phosphoglycerate mutase family 5 n=1 Tax=Melissococcus plutonius (strain ATCC 35311 / DSM 29964 / CIP 104052 / LMG 20360 / NCIMB 702443) TaxID=940190 RepID=F3YC06_MELPT|nr:histidine phosphatase family protein [Melissococcus plutonius]AIM25297.1 phosphoglycerate mutase family 5 [Melissococcus plutonius S1]KMT23983.1 phosphoglycerate mutase family 5 [Melissococcus plutonius]KMT24137.1 phosphoglycerate mutase family 5 [Melissococcus plutonius]KMT25482.1 phosphoglycerate mutase family 5 [Melissococcus plutonius]KMT28628.1 phosphoglycerate mutase family 5 [Melissococcus plutonius]
MKLYFTRHGKTEWNEEMRLQGMHGDSPLLPTSYEEIHALGSYLRNIPFEKIYSSTSLRARITAEEINKQLLNPVEIIYTDLLKELGLGELEGQLIFEMRQLHKIEMDHMRYQLDKYDPAHFAGEPIEEAIERVTSVALEAVESGEGPFLFVGHGASLTAAIQSMCGKSLSELREMGGLKNNSLSILETGLPKSRLPFKLKKWNDHSFLTD